MIRSLLCTLFVLVWASHQAEARDVLVLAIGSERYAAPAAVEQHGFAELPGIADGAREVAEIFQRGGARRVQLLVSTDTTLVSRQDILAAVDEITADATKADKPLIVIYIAAHGISEGLGWSQYSVPGPMIYEGDLATLARRDGLERHAVAAGELVDRLNGYGAPYILILDNCREGRETGNAGVREMLGAEGASLVDAVRQATRMLNEFRGPNPVLFSTPPGTSVPTAAHPDHEMMSIGPLARRLLLWSRQHRPGSSPTIATLVADLRSPGFDTGTSPAVTHAEPGPLWNEPVLHTAANGAPIVERTATGGAPDLCCTQVRVDPGAALRGWIRIVSAPPGYWLAEGQPPGLETPAATLIAKMPDPGTLTIDASQGDDQWSLTLVAPGGKALAPGRYAGAERAYFQAESRPGMSFSTTGRSCNEVAGRFDVRKIENAGTVLRALSADIDLKCDDLPGLISVRVEVVAAPKQSTDE